MSDDNLPCENCEKLFPVEEMQTTKDDCWVCAGCHRALLDEVLNITPREEREFTFSLRRFQGAVHANAVVHGFYEQPPSPLERLALIHEEISEAVSAFRHGNPPDDHISNFSGAEAELADALIRILDMAEYLELDLAGAVIEKMAYNAKRPHKHGKLL